jgi:uncharacterized NAD(P)/FAD-binding protein YdhS
LTDLVRFSIENRTQATEPHRLGVGEHHSIRSEEFAMHEPSPALARLIAAIDRVAAGSPPDLLRMGRALEETPLGVADVAAWIKETERSYHRAVVVRRENYELLVITWRAGQGSPPHDHAGSVSAMKVVCGLAAEETFVLDEEGYASSVAKNLLIPGDLTAWHDAGVHAVSNAGSDTLVTVNVYAPPLGAFRRFNPQPADPVPAAESPIRPTILVIGGGFSGTVTAAQLVRQAEATGVGLRILIADRSGTVGEGVAYGTSDEAHLLNVPAGRMSAWPDRPSDFVDWVNRSVASTDPADFVPRAWYGRYVRETLLAERRHARVTACETLFDEVRRISRRPSGDWVAHFANGTSVLADELVLTIGHRPPCDPLADIWTGSRSRYVANPWRPFATAPIGPGDPVVILGTGLTAIDMLVSLNAVDRTAPVHLVSRRGLTPRVHVCPATAADDMETLATACLAGPRGLRVRDVVRRVRRATVEAAAAGTDWRGVIDGLRPHTAVLWASASSEERQRFLRHVRPIWEVVRHRMAPELGQRLETWRGNGLLEIVAGRIESAMATDAGVRLGVRRRGAEERITLDAAWVINCTGPEPSNRAEANPVIGSLLLQGWVTPDELNLGLLTTADGRAVGRGGDAVPGLNVVGTLRKPAAWESTAVPELRVQAEAVAAGIVSRVREVVRKPAVSRRAA